MSLLNPREVHYFSIKKIIHHHYLGEVKIKDKTTTLTNNFYVQLLSVVNIYKFTNR